jgi:hypothetical protein
LATYTTNKDESITKKLANGKTFTVAKNDARYQRVKNESVSNTSSPKTTTPKTSNSSNNKKSSSNKISGATYDEIVRKARARESLTNPTAESQAIYDSYAGAFSIAGGGGGASKKKKVITPFDEDNLSVTPYDNSEYMERIEDILSGLDDIGQFSYDPVKDQSFQSFLNLAQGQGQTAFNNQIGTLSSMTGGRPNSWSTAAASQAQNQIVSDANAQMPAFEAQAYNQWQGNQASLLQKAELIMSLDNAGYAKYVDEINTRFELTTLQMQQAAAAIEQKQVEIANAMDRVKLLGYVDNETSVILGVPPGTKSFEAQQAIQAKQDWLWQQQEALKMDLQKMQKAYSYDRQLISAREAASGSSSGNPAKESGGNSFGIKTAAAARKFFEKLFNEEDKAYGIEFSEMEEVEKYATVSGIIQEIGEDPTLTDTKKEEIFKYIYENTPIEEWEKKFYNSYR